MAVAAGVASIVMSGGIAAAFGGLLPTPLHDIAHDWLDGPPADEGSHHSGAPHTSAVPTSPRTQGGSGVVVTTGKSEPGTRAGPRTGPQASPTVPGRTPGSGETPPTPEQAPPGSTTTPPAAIQTPPPGGGKTPPGTSKTTPPPGSGKTPPGSTKAPPNGSKTPPKSSMSKTWTPSDPRNPPSGSGTG